MASGNRSGKWRNGARPAQLRRRRRRNQRLLRQRKSTIPRRPELSGPPPRRVCGLAYMPRSGRSREERLGDGLGWLSCRVGSCRSARASRCRSRHRNAANIRGCLRAVRRTRAHRRCGASLTQRDRTPWLWSRVIGDAMDLALIGTALRPSNPGRGRRARCLRCGQRDRRDRRRREHASDASDARRVVSR